MHSMSESFKNLRIFKVSKKRERNKILMLLEKQMSSLCDIKYTYIKILNIHGLFCLQDLRFDSRVTSFLSLVEITAFRLERIFQPMRALKFITGHMVYDSAHN